MKKYINVKKFARRNTMAGAGAAGEKNVMRIVEEIEGDGSVVLFEKPIDPVGPTQEEIKGLAEWERNLFTPPAKE